MFKVELIFTRHGLSASPVKQGKAGVPDLQQASTVLSSGEHRTLFL